MDRVFTEVLTLTGSIIINKVLCKMFSGQSSCSMSYKIKLHFLLCWTGPDHQQITLKTLVDEIANFIFLSTGIPIDKVRINKQGVKFLEQIG